MQLLKLIFTGFLSLAILTGGLKARAEILSYHEIKVDDQGEIVPWFNPDPSVAYDRMINLVFNFWINLKIEDNGLPYYMNHQVWKEQGKDIRGLGGDQFSMTLSSWQLFYAYSGNMNAKQNMKFIADYYLAHSLSPSDAVFANLPFPYNTKLFSGEYDGDMINGLGVLQPDKAGSFGLELIHLYKMTTIDSDKTASRKYLDAAIKIAQSLIKNMKDGNDQFSPLPFKVNALTGEVSTSRKADKDHTVNGLAGYTTNWAPTMQLFLELENLDSANRALYQAKFNVFVNWFKAYPLKTNKWGPFFEDVPGWSQTQINPTTFALFMLEHREYFPEWQSQVPKIFDWVHATLGTEKWADYGAHVIYEQTAYMVPGQSHDSRQGATELLYAKLSGDTSGKDAAIRLLNWSTYMVDFDGKNRFPQDEIWLTDGYGDYVRHYLRAMAAMPELAPKDANHILSSTSVVQKVSYKARTLSYRAFDMNGTETIRLLKKPKFVFLGISILPKTIGDKGIRWTPLENGGVLEIDRDFANEVRILL